MVIHLYKYTIETLIKFKKEQWAHIDRFLWKVRINIY